MNSSNFFETLWQAAATTSIWEWLAIITALIYVVLAAKENAWCWSFGIISSGLYIWLNYSIRLYLDSWLSVYYCVIGIYGWYVWIRGRTDKSSGAVLHRIKNSTLFISIFIGITATLILGKISSLYTDSPVPYFDAALTSFSLVATWMTARKILENWIFWIVIDAAYVIIYWMRALPSTSILFLIYTFIAVYGFIKWRKNLKEFTA
jgi:nicotinamide mononucleotide transporter